MTEREIFFYKVNEERERQIKLWGGDRDQDMHLWLSILSEEVGECHKAALEGNELNFKDELIQVAAVCGAIFEEYFRLTSTEEKGKI